MERKAEGNGIEIDQLALIVILGHHDLLDRKLEERRTYGVHKILEGPRYNDTITCVEKLSH